MSPSSRAELAVGAAGAFEYGVMWNLDVHRSGMTREEAEQWIEEFVESGGRPGVFSIVRRAIGPWEKP